MKNKLSTYEKQLNKLLSAIEITSSSSYKVEEELIKVYQQSPCYNYIKSLSDFGKHEQIDETLTRKQLHQHLTNTLYTRFYCGVKKEDTDFKLPDKRERVAFMKNLSLHNNSVQDLDKNWMIYSIDSQGGMYAEKNGTLRPVIPNTYITESTESTMKVGQNINFYRQKEKFDAQPVFYYVFGNEYLTNDCDKIRIYWNILPEAAGNLVHEITSILNEYRIPFHFKCLNHPDLFKRNDNAVLYINVEHLSIVSLLIRSIITVLKESLIDRIPLFTKKIAAGVSIAEDPGLGQSFGMSRSEMIAESLIKARENAIDDVTERNLFIKQFLVNNGIGIDRIYLNPHTNELIFEKR
ncbi:T3SS effector HopA1 family protein [uncultured Tenacibaculum sp.]|uniref:T3SS effector HopA1 family protein n=1 Tax=uncultured Tenacibaculum sp. TaxID=174713 RepID=UPI00262B4CA9|nr:T3SS effector HopA1 family protein [uncultured Tenacibaculum sp.]